MRISPTLAAIACMVTAVPADAQRAPKWAGVWRNASNSVHLRAAPCGRSMCGTVIWASEKAKADVAARGGRLVGTQLFRNFQAVGDGSWEGEVFVPDIGATLTGNVRLEGNDRLVGEGCLFGGLGCRQQVWTRIKGK